MINWYILAFISAIGIALGSVFRKKLLFKEHSKEYLLSVFILTSIVLIPFVNYLDFQETSLALWALIYAKSILWTAGLIFATKSARHMEISSRDPLLNLSPIILVVLAFLFLGEKITLINGAGIALIIIGAYTLEMDKRNLKPKIKKNKYLFFLISSLTLFSFSALLDRILIFKTTQANLLIGAILLTTINLIIFEVVTTKKHFRNIKESFKVGGILLPLIVIVGLTSDIAYLKAIANPKALIALVIAVKRTSTLMSTIIGGEILHEKNLAQKIISTIIMIAGAILVIL